MGDLEAIAEDLHAQCRIHLADTTLQDGHLIASDAPGDPLAGGTMLHHLVMQQGTQLRKLFLHRDDNAYSHVVCNVRLEVITCPYVRKARSGRNAWDVGASR